jgi:superfamily I DNA/RNA helicase
MEYRGGHRQVIAWAGSGKAESIARPFASLIAQNGVEPGAIIAFTFGRTSGGPHAPVRDGGNARS